ncbi:hypothetical protein BK662_09485 [Pseudomonas frederiksbergensis]|uniref:Arginine/ornithine antiporter n=1 Tax=Pseudomonas frederiksbergensis TaxID=104087 RepID=A0A423HU23_9PSED|nr:hypothetical protein BK662_09485 [Pseudomonas frederiksbergensis]
MSQPTQKLRLSALIALVVGSMIGGGIFSLPQNMAARADAGAILIGWAITVVGMLTAKREQGEPLFTHVEKGIFSCVVAGAGLAAYGLYSGLLSL